MIKIYTISLIVLFTISCQVAPVQQEQSNSTNSIITESENEFTGKVVGIADGDTATVLDDTNTQHKIRFLGINAPEKAQAFGQKSKQNLSDLIFGKTVAFQVLKRDKYNREVAKILLDAEDRILYASTEEEARFARCETDESDCLRLDLFSFGNFALV